MSSAGNIPKLLAAVRRGEVTHVLVHPETAAESGELIDLFRSAGLTIREDRNVEKGQVYGMNQRALLPLGWSFRDKLAEKLGVISPERLARLRKKLPDFDRRLLLGEGESKED